MSKMILRTGIAVMALLVGLLSVGYAQTFITFDVPGSTSTGGAGIDPTGQIVGTYSNGTFGDLHGFLRHTDGTFTTFDVPNSISTDATAINPAGQITGFYAGTTGCAHGYLRQTDGSFTTFDVAGSCTFPEAINPIGQITGEQAALAAKQAGR